MFRMLEAKHKPDIKTSVLRQLKDQRDILLQAVQTAAEATTHSEAKQEGKYDTRAIEASYLAGAQAERLDELEQKIAHIERLLVTGSQSENIKVTSLICIDEGETKNRWYMILPGAAGIKVNIQSIEVTILSPESKLGIELLGKSLGEEIEFAVGRVVKFLRVEAVI
jgi:transcription elongation GreA/GreB family factor